MTAADLASAEWREIVTQGHTAIVGPFWTRGVDGVTRTALLAEARHCNTHMGTVHGGVVATLADIGLGVGAVAIAGDDRCVTIDLQIHYVAAARPGDLMVCRPEVVRRTHTLIFMRGTISVGDATTAAVSGIWKIVAAQAAVSVA